MSCQRMTRTKAKPRRILRALPKTPRRSRLAMLRFRQLDCAAADLAQEGLLMRHRQPFDRRCQRQPFHGLDVAGEHASRRIRRLHPPEMDDLWTTTGPVRDHTKELAYGNVMAGFLGCLTPRRGDGT